MNLPTEQYILPVDSDRPFRAPTRGLVKTSMIRKSHGQKLCACHRVISANKLQCARCALWQADVAVSA